MSMRGRSIPAKRHKAGQGGAPGAACADPLLSRDEASQFRALRNTLPDGWVAELQPEAGMAWAAFVYQAEAPRSSPMFTVCRWDDRAGVLVQWMDGSASSAMAFTELWPILELIQNGIFASMQAHLATVPTEDWAKTQH